MTSLLLFIVSLWILYDIFYFSFKVYKTMILASTNNQPYLTVLFLMCFFSYPPLLDQSYLFYTVCCCSTKATYSIQFAAVQLKLPMGVCLCVKLWECVCVCVMETSPVWEVCLKSVSISFQGRLSHNFLTIKSTGIFIPT